MTSIFSALPCQVLEDRNYTSLSADILGNYYNHINIPRFEDNYSKLRNAKIDISDNREDKKSENKSILAA